MGRSRESIIEIKRKWYRERGVDNIGAKEKARSRKRLKERWIKKE